MTYRIPCLVRRLCLALALLVLVACRNQDAAPAGNALGFYLPLDSAFVPTASIRPNGEGSLFFLRGEELEQPRLTVRRLVRESGDQDALEKLMNDEMGSQLLDQGEIEATRAVNATGVRARQRLIPFPEQVPDLELLYDLRVYGVGNWHFLFIWQQVPSDTALSTQYESWMKRLRFADDLPSGPDPSTLEP